MNANRYVLIAGTGRSGTNWLLEILDQSRQTHCRNEPNGCAGSAFSRLPHGLVESPALAEELERAWDDSVARTARSFGVRDHAIPVPKVHFSRMAQRLGLARLARAKRPRRALGRVLPSPLAEEWPIPPWVMSRRPEGPTLPVLKVLGRTGWMTWALRNRPEAHVIHIVRHPGGFLNSMMKRVWSRTSIEDVARSNRELLQVVATDPAWAARFGDLDAISPLEAEIWFWRYATETLHRAGAGNPRYQLIIYEDLAANPVEVSRAVYRGCGLDWDEAIEGRIRQMSNQSRAIARAWRDRLNPDQVAHVERILGGSPVCDWWGGTERISPEPAGGVPA